MRTRSWKSTAIGLLIALFVSMFMTPAGAQVYNLAAGFILTNPGGNTTIVAANPAGARTLTIPDPGAATDSFAFLAATQTFTNKTITAPVLSGTATGTYTLGGTPSIGAGGSPLANGLVFYSPSLTPVATAAAIGTTSQTFTVTGLSLSPLDRIYVNGPAPTSLCPMVSYRVSAANTLQLDFSTLTAVACTPASGVYSIVAIR